MMNTKLKIASRLALVLVLSLTMVPSTSFAGCRGECAGMCGGGGNGVRDIVAKSAHEPEEGGCRAWRTVEKVYPCCNGTHPCCKMETIAPENGPEFLMPTVDTDHLKIFRVCGQAGFQGGALPKPLASKEHANFKKARSSPLYLQNLTILC